MQALLRETKVESLVCIGAMPIMTDIQHILPVIGIDLDNTLISYDDLVYRCAVEARLVPAETRRHKKTIRDLIRQLPDGERWWMQIQAYVYSDGIVGASPFEGAMEFLQECWRRDIQTFIVSHKTEYCAIDGKQISLRDHALDWLARNGLFDHRHFGSERERAFFESTRDAKVDRIRMLGCTHFIDDLEEVFVHPNFPASVERLMFDPHAEAGTLAGIRTFHTWRSIADYLFGNRQRGGINKYA